MVRKKSAENINQASRAIFSVIPADHIERCIHVIRARRVILDAELADLYGVKTKQLNQAVKRNIRRFPADFVFVLNAKEKRDVVTNCDHLANLKYSSSLPYAFTEHGALMAANVINSEQAIVMGVEIIRAFVRMRRMTMAVKELARKIGDLERKYDENFVVVFDAIRQLMDPPEPRPKGRIGFKVPKSRKSRS